MNFENIQPELYDRMILDKWKLAAESPLVPGTQLIEKGVAKLPLLKLIPSLLKATKERNEKLWLSQQAELLLRHVEISRSAALSRWELPHPHNLHQEILLVTANQFVRLSAKSKDIRYVNAALKILDWTQPAATSRNSSIAQLHTASVYECEAVLSSWKLTHLE